MFVFVLQGSWGVGNIRESWGWSLPPWGAAGVPRMQLWQNHQQPPVSSVHALLHLCLLDSIFSWLLRTCAMLASGQAPAPGVRYVKSSDSLGGDKHGHVCVIMMQH